MTEASGPTPVNGMTIRDPTGLSEAGRGRIWGSVLQLCVAGHKTNFCKHLLFTKSSYYYNTHLIHCTTPKIFPAFYYKVFKY